MSRAIPIIGFWGLGLITAYQTGRMTGTVAADAPSPSLTARTTVANQHRSPGMALRLIDARAFPQAALKLRTNDEFRKSFEEMLPSLQDGATHDALFMLADVWASKDPAAATEWLAGLKLGDARNPYLFSAFSKWAALDPHAARAWLEANPLPAGDSRDYMLASLIRGLAVSDPDAALKILLDAHPSPERTGSLDFLIRAWTGVSLEHAFEQIAALPDSAGQLKTNAIRKLTSILTGDELASAGPWADGLSSSRDRNAAKVGIAARWSQTDPTAAAKWASGLNEPETRSKAYGEIGTRWARIDPLAASEWLTNHQGQPEMDLAARAIAWSTVGIDPDTAFSQVAAITHEALRDETFEQIGRFWLSRETLTAKQYLEKDSPIPPAIRESLLDSFE